MRGYRTLGLVVAFLALLTGTAFAQQAGSSQAITWTAGALSGGWFDISSGLAALLRKKANLTIQVIPGGGAQNPDQRPRQSYQRRQRRRCRLNLAA